VFINFLLGKIKKLPWCEEFSTHDEITLIKELLLKLNKKNILSINSQPSVNGSKSTDSVVGWGPKNGYVYQKCYIEFFIGEENLKKLTDIINSNEEYSQTIVYQAVNLKGGIILILYT
jgi:methylenetetrahydrofolate reductase (NADPH)